MSASTVIAAKTSLLAMLAASPAFTGVDLRWGKPTKEEDVTGEQAFFGSGIDHDEEWRGLGAGRTEDYHFDLVIRVWMYGDNLQAVETRVWALRDAAALLIHDENTLGGVLNESGAEVSSTRVDMDAFTDGWSAEATLDVHCRAVISPTL